MSDLTAYQSAEGYTDEQMAAMLTVKLGREISATGYKIVKGRRDAPSEWLNALSIAPQDPSSVGDGPSSASAINADDGGDGSAVSPASRPGVLPFAVQSAHMQITLAYSMAGKGAAMAMRSPQVAEIWSAHAPRIADAYIEWAREDATVARWIGILTLGGPKGDLVQLHASMIITTLIVGGKLDTHAFVPPSMRTPEETDLLDHPDEESDEPPPAPKTPRKRAPR